MVDSNREKSILGRQQKAATNVAVLGGRPHTKRLDEARRLYMAGNITSVSLASVMGVKKRMARYYLSRLRGLGLVDNFVAALGVDPGNAATNSGNKHISFPHMENNSEGKKINVHAQRWRALVHFKSAKYLKNPRLLLSSFPDGLGGSVFVDCMNDIILLRSNGQKFWGSSEEEAVWVSVDFWIAILRRLEHRLGVVIIKKGSVDMVQTYAEYETSDSVVCEDAAKRGVMWRVFDDKDGKFRLSTDMSNGGRNHETHHQKTGLSDSEIWNRHVNFILDSPISAEEIAKTLQFVVKAQAINVKQIKELSEGMAVVAAMIVKVGSK